MLLSFAALALAAQAAEFTKDDNTTALNDDASWVGTGVPGASDVAVWDSTVTGANQSALGADTSWGGIKVLSPGGLVTIGSDANILTIGASGIDLSNATQSVYLNGASASVGANDQVWNVASTSYLRLGNGNLDGVLTGSGTITISGSGIVDLNPTVTGAGGFSGKWIVNSGATLRTTRHSQSGDWDALGSNTSADAVTLNGGTLAVGGFTGSGAQGDWTWANPITLAASTSSTISGQLPDTSAGARVLTLTGAISGSGDVTFSKNQLRTMTFRIQNFGTTSGVRTDVLGSGNVTVNGVALELRPTGDGSAAAFTLNNNFKLIGGTLIDYDGNDMTLGGTVTLEGANTIQSHWAGKDLILNGTIQDGTVAGSVTYNPGANETSNAIYVNGDNSYTGGTTLGTGTANKGIVVAGHNNAFGTGALSFRGTRLYAGAAGLTIANNMTVGAGGIRLGGTNSFTLSGTLTMDAASRTIANYSTNGSTITIGGINAISGSTVAFDNAANGATGAPIVVSGAITGAGNVALSYNHNTTLQGANTYTGTTTLSGGRLNLTGSIGASSSVTASGGLLAGTGTINGALTMSGAGIRLAGGAATTSLTFASGATFTASTPVTFDTNPVASTVYDIFTYGSGTVTGGTFVTAAQHGTVSDDTANQKYIFTASGPGTRTWNTTSGTWDNSGTNLNWVEDDKKFYDGDTAVFGDIASDSTITLSGAISPNGVTVQNTANTYTFTGGSITGATGLTKDGAGTLIIANNQSYTGGTTVNGGTLRLQGGGSTGTIRGTLTANSGTTIEVGGIDVLGYGGGTTAVNTINLDSATLVQTQDRNETNTAVINMAGGSTISATGGTSALFDMFGGSAALNASGDSQNTISSPLRLRQNNTTFTVADGAAATDLLISGVISRGAEGNGAIVKAGDGTMELDAANTYTGNTTVSGGTLKIGTGGSLYATGSYFSGAGVTINGGGTLETRNWDYGNGNALNQLRNNYFAVVLDNGMLRFTENTSSLRAFQVNSGGATIEAVNGVTYTKQAGTVASQNIIYGNNAGSLTFTGAGDIVIQDGIGSYGTWGAAAGVTKTGAGTLTLNGSNTYGGVTNVTAGTLEVNGSIAGSSLTTVAAAARLQGTGTVGATTVSGTLAPGTSIGTLNIAGDLELLGVSEFEIDPDDLSADLADVTGNLAYGGTLNVTTLAESSGAYQLGDTFDLFNWGTLAASNFTAVNLPELDGINPAWEWQNNLLTDGTIVVIPETPAALLGALGLLILILRRRV